MYRWAVPSCHDSSNAALHRVCCILAVWPCLSHCGWSLVQYGLGFCCQQLHQLFVPLGLQLMHLLACWAESQPCWECIVPNACCLTELLKELVRVHLQSKFWKARFPQNLQVNSGKHLRRLIEKGMSYWTEYTDQICEEVKTRDSLTFSSCVPNAGALQLDGRAGRRIPHVFLLRAQRRSAAAGR